MKPLPLTEVGMLGPFVEFLCEVGAPVDRTLDQNNLSREMVERGQGKVTKLQFYQFLAQSGPGSGQPDLGFKIGERYGMQFAGPVGSSVLRASTLKDAVDTFAIHLRAWLDGNHLWLEADPANGDQVWLCNLARDGLEKLQAISNQCAVMTLISLVREVAGEDWVPEKARLDANAVVAVNGDTAALASSEIEIIEQGVAIQLPRRFLSQPIKEKLDGDVARPPLESPASFATALATTMRDQLPFQGVPTIQQAAEISGTSPRTLQRLLGADGLTYQRLLDRIRFQIARDLLVGDSRASLAEVAHSSGFSSASSFIRSFRRMANMTPREFAQRSR